MKYTIEGFSQEAMIDMELDCTDACLLRFIVDFIATGRMEQRAWDGVTYYWFKYDYVLEQIPILGLGSPDALARRLRKLVLNKVLLHRTRKDGGGTKSYYCLSEEGANLLFGRSQTTSESAATRPESRSKDSSISDSSIRREDITAPPAASPSASSPFSRENAKKQTDAELKPLILYYSEKHKVARGFEPTIHWARDMAVMKRIRRGYKAAAICQLLDAFFEWKGRTKTTLWDFESKVDTLYGVLLDKATGKR